MASVHVTSEKKSVNPITWVEDRLKDLHRVVFDDEATQLRVQFVSDEAERDRIWDEQHDKAADRLYALCYDLKGFFLKTAQILAKPDLAPLAWVKKLVVLCDQAPATPFSVVQGLVEGELGKSFDDLFDSFDAKPVGSASIAQVHKARLKGSAYDVAVKVQHPGAHELMMTDIRNQKLFARILQKTDLKFDLMSIMDELEEQVEYEFDFEREANAMDKIGRALDTANGKGNSPIIVPRSISGLVTRRVLVMDFIEGTPIMQMPDEMAKVGINPNGMVARIAKRSILKDLSSAYGQMILRDGFFQADPHPGNILINKNGKVALLDYGQTKELSQDLRLGFAKIVIGLANDNTDQIAEAISELGIFATSKSKDLGDTKTLAQLMFDTKLPHGMKMASPFGDDSILKAISVESFPKELFFVLRAVQLLRGLSIGMDVQFSTSEQWKPIAEAAHIAARTSPYYGPKTILDRLPGELQWERRKRLRREGHLQMIPRNSKGYRKVSLF